MKKSTSTSRPRFPRALISPLLRVHARVQGLLARRPHRSFRRTRRRDYVRSLRLPGYWSFTATVGRTIWHGRKQLFLAAFLYAITTGLVVGLASQQIYSDTAELLSGTSQEWIDGGIGRASEATVLLASTVLNNLTGAATPESQAYAGLLAILFWLLLVWLLRAQLAGRRIKLRDGLYNCGAPLISTFLVLIILILQMIPLAFAVIAYSAGSAGGMLTGGAESMLIWLAIILLAVLSLYWSISTILALVVVTLPGMYPLQAIKTAGDLVIGRRVRIFLRLLWAAFVVVAVWALVMIPIIMLDGMIKNTWPAIEWLPIVPILLLVMVSLTLLFVATYIYVLYRKIVDDDAKPA